ncbi:MAG: hypothetical protein WC777_00820 [Candidatus Gracilibacteria bacterium]|jgi:hypothetical protein
MPREFPLGDPGEIIKRLPDPSKIPLLPGVEDELDIGPLGNPLKKKRPKPDYRFPTRDEWDDFDASQAMPATGVWDLPLVDENGGPEEIPGDDKPDIDDEEPVWTPLPRAPERQAPEPEVYAGPWHF